MTAPASRVLEHIRTPALIVARGQVAFANAAAQALLGSHIIGQDVRIAIRSPDAVAAILGESGGTARVDGLSVRGSVWDIDCHVLGDGTRLVSLYDQSVQAGTARAHADFVANASHELRTPLAAILGYVETLQNPKAGDDPATRERFLGTIRHEARRMQALVEDLMSLSRIEAVKHDAPSDPVDMVEIVHSAAGEFRDRAAVEVVANAASAPVLGDRGQLTQVLRNLIDNAVKYGRPGAPVHVALEATATGWLALSVRDEGEGIAPEHLPRLTERFYRADTGRSRAAGGTGLGLAIVKHIVERHRGRFDITSRPGVGTTASLMLPMKQTVLEK
ncbi:MAG: ATP-binding protein [Novosphingobium sp.]|nr:ATP-binding protein [Novosphingobium sp.]